MHLKRRGWITGIGRYQDFQRFAFCSGHTALTGNNSLKVYNKSNIVQNLK
jgi:hypothetical protein